MGKRRTCIYRSPVARPSSFRRSLSRLVCLALLLVFPLTAEAQSEDARFVDGLRQRRLYRLAEEFCNDRLSDARLSDAQRAELVIELIRCYASHAAQQAPQERDSTWQRARATAADFQRDQAQNPQLILVRVQDALTVAARGDLLRLEAELLAEPGSSLEDAKNAFREADRMLEQLDSELIREIPQRHRQTPPPGGLTADELTALQHQVRFQRSRAQRGLALCYAPESDDRVAMLTQAVATLRQPLTQLAAADPLTDRLRIQLAGCHRLLGNFEAAAESLRAVQPAADQADTALEARAESVRLELAQRRPQRALEVLGEGRQIGDRVSPELDFAHLETYLDLWHTAHDAGEASQAENWRSKSVAMVQLIEQVHGPYWGRRSDLLLVNSIGGVRGAADVEVLTRTADNLYRKGQGDEAIAVYEKAAQVAAAANQLDLAFQLRYKAALVDQNRQRHENASEKLRMLGRDLRDEAKAAEAHLLAAWNAAQCSRADPAALDTYAEILAEHLRLWPQDKTADTARVWLGRLRESQQDWSAAAAAYQGVTRESDQFGESLEAAVRCRAKQFSRLRDRRESTEAAAQTAADFLAQQIGPQLTDPSLPWTGQDRFCAEHAARFLVRHTPRGGPQAEVLLQASLSGKPPPDSKERGRAEAILVVALASQAGKIAEAERVVRRLSGQSPQLLLELLKDLSAIAESAPAEAQKELAALWLAALEALGSGTSQFDPAVQEELNRNRARSLAAAGRHDEATLAYRDLAAGHQDDAQLQAAYAELLLGGSDQKSWSEALDLWRRIAARSRPQTGLWYRAKYANSLALFKLGQKHEAADRIRYLQATTPGLQNTPWAQRFAELLRKCQ